MDYATIIDRLEAEIRQYRIDYQRYFNGDTHIPPEELGDQIRKRLTSTIAAPRLSAVDRFRLGGLESRYNSLKELFGRRMREAEHRARSVPAEAATRTDDPVVVLDAESRASEVADLWQAIYGQRERQIGLDEFHTYLADQAARVRRKAGCEKVRFTVRSEEGKPKLKARPLREPES